MCKHAKQFKEGTIFSSFKLHAYRYKYRIRLQNKICSIQVSATAEKKGMETVKWRNQWNPVREFLIDKHNDG